jgi:hypothetical protein
MQVPNCKKKVRYGGLVSAWWWFTEITFRRNILAPFSRKVTLFYMKNLPHCTCTALWQNEYICMEQNIYILINQVSFPACGKHFCREPLTCYSLQQLHHCSQKCSCCSRHLYSYQSPKNCNQKFHDPRLTLYLVWKGNCSASMRCMS